MLVQLEHVRKKYGSFTLELNMQIPEDRIIGLIGANGAGKSTTFKLMLGLIRPDQGTVEVLGRNAADLGADIHAGPAGGFIDYYNAAGHRRFLIS